MADAVTESQPSPSEVKMEVMETDQEQNKESGNKLNKEENGKDLEPPVCQSGTLPKMPQDLVKGNSNENVDKESGGQSDIVVPDQGPATASDANMIVAQEKDKDSLKVEMADPGKATEDGSNTSAKEDESKIGLPDKTDESESMKAGDDGSNLTEKVDRDKNMIPENVDKSVTSNVTSDVKQEPKSPPPQPSESMSGKSLIETGNVAKAEENIATQKDNNTLESSVGDVEGQKVSNPKDLVTLKEETVSALNESKVQAKEAGEKTDAFISVSKVDESVTRKETVGNENVKKENITEETNDPLVTDAEMKDAQPQVEKERTGQTNDENTSNMGAMLRAVKIEEVAPNEKLTEKVNNSEKNMTVSSKEPKAPDNENMQVDAVTHPLPETAPIQKKEALAPEAIVSESKAVHEIIAEQSVRTERESAALSSIPVISEKTESIVASAEASSATTVPKVSLVETAPGAPLGANVPDALLAPPASGASLPVNLPDASLSAASVPPVASAAPVVPAAPVIPETKVEIKDAAGDDWDIPASDEEEGSEKPEGESAEEEKKKKRVGVKRGYWEPPTEVIVELYRRLDKEGILELSWKCPGRRPPSEEGDREEEKEQLKEEVDEEEMEISQDEEEDPTEFDFDIDTDSSVQKMTPRRGIGTGQAQGSGKKRVARMDKVLSDIFRHRKIDSDFTNEKKQDAVPMETGEAMDTTPAANVTPSRPPDKFHIRSDLT